MNGDQNPRSDKMTGRTVCVIGLGYIGLPTAVALSSRGVHVIGVDTNQGVVDTINAGRATFVEPDLAIAVSGAVAMGFLEASTQTAAADAFIIAVPTPFKSDKTADLDFIKSATKSMADQLRPGNLVVLESTSPPGTTELVSRWLATARPDLTFPHQAPNCSDVKVAHCPERVLPGRIMVELVENDRIVGGLDYASSQAATDLYSIFASGHIAATSAMSAELAKLVENSFRDVNIAFANELSLICDHLGADVHEVIELANRHPRVDILSPGPGVGGHCIAVDPWFVVSAAPDQAKLVRLAREVNDAKPSFILDKVTNAIKSLDKPVIACLGLTFKKDVDDFRGSPALEIVARITESTTAEIIVAEPHVTALPSPLNGTERVRLASTEEALAKANIVLLLVDHTEFGNLDRTLLEGKTVIDTRGIWR